MPVDDPAAVRPGAEGIDRAVGWRGLGFAAVWFVAGFVLSGVAAAIVAGARGESLGGGAVPSQPVTTAGQVGLALGIAVAPLVVGRLRRPAAPDATSSLAVFGLRFRLLDLPLGVAGGVVGTIVTTLLYLPFQGMVDRQDLEKPATDLVNAAHATSGGVAMLIIGVCVVAPVAEEIFFRGIVYRALTRLAGLPAGLVLAGVVFGGAHFELLQLPGLAVFGMLLCALFHRTGRLGPGIVAHCTFNAITVVQLLAR